eukprot:1142058-Pelagomonas_calceolata.AAC.3
MARSTQLHRSSLLCFVLRYGHRCNVSLGEDVWLVGCKHNPGVQQCTGHQVMGAFLAALRRGSTCV